MTSQLSWIIVFNATSGWTIMDKEGGGRGRDRYKGKRVGKMVIWLIV